jgi:hypothetical protein
MANQVLYGFANLKDLWSQRATEVGVAVVGDALRQSLAEHNRQMDTMMAIFARRTTLFKQRYTTPAVARLQPLDENGRALPIKAAGIYDVAWPIHTGGSAWGTNYITREKMTVEDVNNRAIALMSADIRWMRDHILAALFARTTWTYTDEAHGALSIKGLANADTDTYYLQAGADSGATEDHYLFQAAAIADATNPFPTIYTELTEHPENSGEIVAFVPSGLIATTEALTLFRPLQDPNISPGSGVTTLTGTLGMATPGVVRGYVERVWIVEWPSLPANYIIAVSTGGDPPLAMREDPESSLQGFNMVADRDDHPYYEHQWLRRAGFGGFNRVGALIYRVGTGSWAVPTGYTSPMA